MGRSSWTTVGLAAAAAAAILGAGGIAAAVLAPDGAGSANAATSDTQSATNPAAGITVTGTGEASGTPDQVLLAMSVEVHAKTTTAALDGMSERSTRVLDALRKSGVPPADLGTTGLSVQPDYRYDNAGQHLIGYVASENVSATLRSMRTAGKTIGDAVAAGGNAAQVSSISLAIDKDSALMHQARAKAFAAAKEKATQYADLAGRGLGSVISLTETETAKAQQVTTEARGSADAAKAAVPVEPGSQPVSVQVSVTWAVR